MLGPALLSTTEWPCKSRCSGKMSELGYPASKIWFFLAFTFFEPLKTECLCPFFQWVRTFFQEPLSDFSWKPVWRKGYRASCLMKRERKMEVQGCGNTGEKLWSRIRKVFLRSRFVVLKHSDGFGEEIIGVWLDLKESPGPFLWTPNRVSLELVETG